jgi:hypothetical protein
VDSYSTQEIENAFYPMFGNRLSNGEDLVTKIEEPEFTKTKSL